MKKPGRKLLSAVMALTVAVSSLAFVSTSAWAAESGETLLDDCADIRRWSYRDTISQTDDGVRLWYSNPQSVCVFKNSFDLTGLTSVSFNFSSLGINKGDTTEIAEAKYDLFTRSNGVAGVGIRLTSAPAETLPLGYAPLGMNIDGGDDGLNNLEAFTDYGVCVNSNELFSTELTEGVNTFSVDMSSAGQYFDITAVTGIAFCAEVGKPDVDIVIGNIKAVCASGKRAEDAQNVINKITAIGKVTRTNETPITDAEAARDAFLLAYGNDAITDITNIEVLNSARSLFNAMTAAIAQRDSLANNVVNLISEIGEVTVESKAKIEQAEAAYAAFTGAYGNDGAALVTNYNVLTAARTAYNALVGFVYGDIDYNYDITSADALLALNISIAQLEADENTLARGDVNADGTINACDALLILNFAVNNISSFPVQSK